MRPALICLLSALLALLPVSLPLLAQDTPLLLQNARLVIGDGGVIEQGSLLLHEGRIQAVIDPASPGAGTTAAGAEAIDFNGKTVMPAMIDVHSHLGYQAADSWGADNYTHNNLIDNLQRYAYFGFGAVFSAGSDPAGFAQALQAAQEAGEFQGARMLFAAGMAPPGEGPNNLFLVEALQVEERLGQPILYGLSTVQQARQAVRTVANNGIHYIKLWVDDRGGTQHKLAAPVYRAVADTAGEHGIRVFVHQQYAGDMPDLLAAGVHGFLHGRLGTNADGSVFGRELARLVAESGTFVVPNLGLAELRSQAIANDPFLREILTPAGIQRMSAGAGTRQAEFSPNAATDAGLRNSLAYLLAANADIVLGTDAGALPDHPFGYTGHRELEIYVRLGMTPMQALVAATSNAARHLGLNDSGVLRPNARADLLILNSNPLEDIRHTQSIYAVYLAGEVLDRDALRRRFSDTTTPP
ncbi:MAG: amidohydrolase family protein [Pseudohongiellaceae bacterium]